VSEYADLLRICDADARRTNPGVARLCGLVAAMPAELVLADEQAAGEGR